MQTLSVFEVVVSVVVVVVVPAGPLSVAVVVLVLLEYMLGFAQALLTLAG